MANHLKKVLAEPGRMEQERAFAAAHQEDTDRQLYDYVKAEKRRLGKKLKAYSFETNFRYPLHRLRKVPAPRYFCPLGIRRFIKILYLCGRKGYDPSKTYW